MSTVRVMQVVHGLPRGGLENGVINLLNGLPEDIEQAVVCLDKRGEMADRIQHEMPLHVLHRGKHDLGAIWRLSRIIKQWQPDVVHCRNWNTWPDTVLAHRLAGMPGKLVWSFHGFFEGRGTAPWRRQVASRWLANNTDVLFGVCQDAANRYADVNGLDKAGFRVLYNGVDTRRFCPSARRSGLRAQFGWREGECIFLTVASLTPVKDHAHLLNAVAGLSIDKPFRLVFIGEGAERSSLEALVEKLGLQGRVEMPGGSDQVPALLAAADVAVLPSRLEGMSNAITEAMAAGVPMIARAVGGNTELIVDNETGRLCDPSEVVSMTQALQQLLADKEARMAMGIAARARAEQAFSMQAMMRRYADLYRELGA